MMKIKICSCWGDTLVKKKTSSLIKNPGGGLAPIGGYIAGTKERVENANRILETAKYLKK